VVSGSAVDVFEIDAASNRGIDEIRELRDTVRYPPSRDRYKVFIIDEVHMLTTPAFNALLKTLEEPPPFVVFIFATTEPHKIPPTILSRCQRHDFRRIPPPVVANHLAKLLALEGLEAEEAALQLIAKQSEGCMRDAQSHLDQLISFTDGVLTEEMVSRVLGIVGREVLTKLSGSLLTRDVRVTLDLIAQAYENGANLIRLSSDFLEHLRDLAVTRLTHGKASLDHLNEAEISLILEQVSHVPVSNLYRMFDVLMETTEQMTKSAYPKLLLEMGLMRMASIEPIEPVGQLVQRIENILDNGLPTPSEISSSPPPVQQAVSSKAGKRSVQDSKDEPIGDTPEEKPVQSQAQPSYPSLKTPDEHSAAWRNLVNEIHQDNPRLGGILKIAHLEVSTGSCFSISLAGVQYDILNDPKKLSLTQEVAQRLYGPDSQVIPKQRALSDADASTDSFSISQEEDLAIEEQQNKLVSSIKEHPKTAMIQDIFEPSKVTIDPRKVTEDAEENIS
jgi:DNA polymerase-3 subunit gamma/tau